MGLWLSVYCVAEIIIGVLTHNSVDERKKFALRFPNLLWVWAGVYFLSHSTTCQKTNPELYDFVNFYGYYAPLIDSIVITLMTCTCACFPRRFLFFLMNSASSPQSASRASEIFDAIPLAHTSIDTDGGLTSDGESYCPICLNTLNDSGPVKKTPCGHLIHAECLEPWLNLRTTCPTCQTDLESPADSP